MRIELFRMERTQCLYEHEVEYNLSESGVLPVRIEELLDDPAERERFLSLPLKYAESDGSPLLRERIAAWYPGIGWISTPPRAIAPQPSVGSAAVPGA